MFIITIAATAGTPPHAESVRENGETGREMSAYTPIIFTANNDNIPKFGITFKKVDLLPNGDFDYENINNIIFKHLL